ncbi:hypothetical protein [Salinisphaera orenii]|uniref:hypothetical protein n=1 Tax=Salinisphaera orenii TaxID=856731 RepID=UPI0011CDBCCF|nr:hypothetical protein [Salinisphaera halophila]
MKTSEPAKAPSGPKKLEIAQEVLAYAETRYAAHGFDFDSELSEVLFLALWAHCGPQERRLLGIVHAL